MLYGSIVTKPSQREAYDRRPVASAALSFEEYTERVPMPVTRANAVLVEGQRYPMTGKRRTRRDGLGFPVVEVQVATGPVHRTWVLGWWESTDVHTPARAAAMLLYPPTISEVEGASSVSWRAT